MAQPKKSIDKEYEEAIDEEEYIDNMSKEEEKPEEDDLYMEWKKYQRQ